MSDALLLDERRDGLYASYESNPEAIEALDAKRTELEKVKTDPAAFRSFFLVLGLAEPWS